MSQVELSWSSWSSWFPIGPVGSVGLVGRNGSNYVKNVGFLIPSKWGCGGQEVLRVS